MKSIIFLFSLLSSFSVLANDIEFKRMSWWVSYTEDISLSENQAVYEIEVANGNIPEQTTLHFSINDRDRKVTLENKRFRVRTIPSKGKFAFFLSNFGIIRNDN